MAEEFESLFSLDSFLLDSLTKQDVVAFATELQKFDCITQDALNIIASSDDNQVVTKLTLAIADKSAHGWKNTLMHCFDQLANRKVAEIVKCWFDQEQKSKIAWMVVSWNEMLKEELNIKQAMTVFTNYSLQSDQWLLDFCYFVACDETDSESKTKLVEMLKKKFSDSESSLFDKSELFSIHSEEELIKEAQHNMDSVQNNFTTGDFEHVLSPDESTESTLEDIQDAVADAAKCSEGEKSLLSLEMNNELVALLPLFRSALSDADIKFLAEEMYFLDHLSKTTTERFDEEIFNSEDLFALFVECLQKEAKETWKKDLLDAITQLDDEEKLHDIVGRYFEKPNDDLNWFIQNWELLDRKEDFADFAVELGISEVLVEKENFTLFNYFHQVLSVGDDALQELVAALTKKEDPVEVQESKTLEEEMEDILHLLSPLFSSMMEKEFRHFVRELVLLESGNFLKNNFQEFRKASLKTNQEETFELFIQHWKKDVKSNWKEALVTTFHKRGLPMLGNAVKFYFENPDTVSWFFLNWDLLQNKRDELTSAAQSLDCDIQINEETTWLLCYIDEAIKLGKEQLESLVSAIKTDEKEIENDEILKTTSEVRESLVPLIPVLKQSLVSQDINQIAKVLYASKEKNLSPDSLNDLRRHSESAIDIVDLIIHFINCLEKDAKKNWKEDFLTALDHKKHENLHHLIEYHLEHPCELSWFLDKWDLLNDKQNEVYMSVKKLGFDIQLNEEDDMSLLFLVNEVIKLENESLQKLLVALTQQNETPDTHEAPDSITYKASANTDELSSTDICSVFDPLFDLLKSTMTLNDIVLLANKICSASNDFAKASLGTLNETAKSGSVSTTLKKFIDCLSKDAKGTWKKSLLEALQQESYFVLRDVLEFYFDNPNEIMWFFINWNSLLNCREEISKTAQNLDFDFEINEEDGWLLSFVEKLITASEGSFSSFVSEFTCVTKDGDDEQEEQQNEEEESMEEDVENEEQDVLLDDTDSISSMEPKLESLMPLFDVLKICLQCRDMFYIANQMKKMNDEIFSKDYLEELKKFGKSTNDFEIVLKQFDDRLNKDAVVTWKEVFLSALLSNDFRDLHEMLKFYFEKPKRLDWILENWGNLLERQEEIEKVAENLNFDCEIMNQEETWLICFINKVIEQDEEVLISVIKKLNQAEVCEDEQTKLHEDNKKKEAFDKNKDYLPPLFDLLRIGLSSRELGYVADELVRAKKLSEDSVQLVRTAATSGPLLDAIKLLIECLTKDANKTWKDALLKALQETDNDMLHDVVNYHFDYSKEIVGLLEHWNLSNKEEFLAAAQEQGYNINITKRGEIWLLAFIRKLIKSDVGAISKIINAFGQQKQSAKKQSTLNVQLAPTSSTKTSPENRLAKSPKPDKATKNLETSSKADHSDNSSGGEYVLSSTDPVQSTPKKPSFREKNKPLGKKTKVKKSSTKANDEKTNQRKRFMSDYIYKRFTGNSVKSMGEHKANCTFELEFRARLPTFGSTKQKIKQISVYVENGKDQMCYPMEFSARTKEFRLNITIKVGEGISLVYKYCIPGRFRTTYENLKHFETARSGLLNRSWFVTEEQDNCRYAILYDVVLFESVSEKEYKERFVESYVEFLASEVSMFHDFGTNSHALRYVHCVFENWLSVMIFGFVLQPVYGYRKQSYTKPLEEDVKVKLLSRFYKLLTKNTGNAADTVIHTLLFVTAFNGGITLENIDVKRAVCSALSVDQVEDFDKLFAMMLCFSECWSFFQRTELQMSAVTDAMKEQMKWLSYIPESILVFPLLALLHKVVNKGQDANVLSQISSIKSRAQILWYSSENQKRILAMKEKVINLLDAFPWMSKVYSETLTSQTIAQKLHENDAGIAMLIDIDVVFTKLIEYSENTLQNNQILEKVVITEMVAYVKDAVVEAKELRRETDERAIKSWINQSMMLLGLLAAYISAHFEERYVQVVKDLFDMMDTIIVCAEKYRKNFPNNDEFCSLFDELLARLLQALHQLVQDNNVSLSAFEVKLWSTMIDYNWKAKLLKKVWKDQCDDTIRASLEKKFSNAEEIISYYATEFDSLRPSLALDNCLSAVLIKFVEEKEPKASVLTRLVSFFVDSQKPTFLNVICTVFENKWKEKSKQYHQCNETKKSLMFLEQWRPASTLFCILCESTAKEKQSNISDTVTIISDAIVTLLSEVCEGSITVSSLMSLQNVQSFWKCYLAGFQFGNAKRKYLSGIDNERKYTGLLELRLKELDKFVEVKNAVEKFEKFALSLQKDKIDVKCADLQKSLEKFSTDCKLSDLVNCKKYPPNNHVYQPKFFSFAISDIEMMIYLAKCLESDYPQRVLHDILEECNIFEYTIATFRTNIWTPAWNKINETVNQLDKGTIALQSVDRIFQNDADLPEVTNQLQSLSLLLKKDGGNKIENFKRRADQISKYLTQKRQQRTAAVLLELKNKLMLKGNFEDLEHLQDIGETLNDITSKANDTFSDLKSVTQKQLIVLENFCEGNLLNWLKENMKDMTDVKIMSDLAMISAGETTMEVDKVSCFLSAVNGFSPLIFDLVAHRTGLKELLHACKQVWDNLEKDESLLEKWNDTNKQMEWLITVMELRGSVEKSSLSRAQMINESGYYVIGKEKEKIPSVKKCLKLYIPKSESSSAADAEMTLDELHDLQSRLMLIAGEADKGKNDVSRFIDVLSYVENLAKAYVQLKRSGCLLFINWNATIRCNKTLELKQVTMEVCFDESAPIISSRQGVLLELDELTRVLHAAHKKWEDYLMEKRNMHYHLNHFNINQLTYICKKLTSSDGKNFPDQVYQMLARFASDLSYQSVAECLDEVTKIHDDIEANEIIIPQVDEALEENDLEKKRKIIRKLIQQEISQNLAKAAVQAVEPLDYDDCYFWALENANDMAKINKLQKDYEEEIAFMTNDADISALQDVLNERVNLSLKELIEKIQGRLEQNDDEGIAVPIKTVCEKYLDRTAATSLQDCISLEHLGKFLTRTAASGKRKVLNRKFPDGFRTGKPNLIVCPKSDMWKAVLSVYMASADEGLPSTSEVLVCSNSTNAEDIELLLRRAMQRPCDEGKLIYCLACADEVDNTTASKAELTYLQLMQLQNRNPEFRLVVLVSSLHHYITALFDEHRVDANFMCTDEELKVYVRKNVSSEGMEGDIASVVDREHCMVRLIVSKKAGMGKSLFVRRKKETLTENFEPTWNSSTIRFLEKNVDIDDTIFTLTHCGDEELVNADPHFVHIDITPAVENGVHKFLFDLIILGEVKSSEGVVWRRHLQHFYILEYTFPPQGHTSFANILDLLPKSICLSPRQVLEHLQQNPDDSYVSAKVLMDSKLLASQIYQRPFQYLQKFASKEDLDKFVYGDAVLDPLNCIKTFLSYCSIPEPSWSELSHFSNFLNTQLLDCEKSLFLNLEKYDIKGELLGFKQFVVRFMIRMSQDFSTPSLQLEEGESNEQEINAEDLFELHQLRRRWEKTFHPYLFFNNDGMSLSFVHFNINDQGDLCHPKTDEIVESQIMTQELLSDLKAYQVQVRQDFDKLERNEKLQTLCNVFGVEVFDPDPTYELTTDNVLKILAIHMRFRCGIPVIVMGETGCGKTRMIEFMSKLKKGEQNKNTQNMVVIKVHGGITVSILQNEVKNAVDLAQQNTKKFGLETLLFLDEANTTEAIYAIKEIVCDGTVHGHPFVETGLKIVAACNPYRKYDESLIIKLQETGLGFNVKNENVMDRFGGIPMRHLVYRVIPLPPSMQPLVWDFGQLNDDTEEVYIKQMVLKLQSDIENDERVDNLSPEHVDAVAQCLSSSQKYMREKRDVCSFVSLRDVERTIMTFKWFHKNLEMLTPFIKIEKRKDGGINHPYSLPEQALIHAVGVCYHVTLDDRESYREVIASILGGSEKDILREILACQKIFINDITLEKNIGRNEALRENVFMIAICAELRIPLFLIGKPGSSKSLAKTIVTDAMQGRSSKSKLFKKLKQIHVSSFQCSAITDAIGIEVVFNQCARLQKNQPLDEFVAVVVLDEIGLAEDSPKMPLKVLHPLLENASTNTHLAAEPHSKVGFVGISNWALDPAKMNRGIFVTRGKPSHEDLQKTAVAIFESDKKMLLHVSNDVIKALTSAYLQIYEDQPKEFFGLRDYYGLMKMLFALVKKEGDLKFRSIARSILRNFSGSQQNVMEVFRKFLAGKCRSVYPVQFSVIDLIHENLNSTFESRYLLLLTNQYSAVGLLPEVMGAIKDYQVVFGSSFPRDSDYTEVCRNINRIKVCMETGKAVVLLNLQDLYESLYDALNQHYVSFAGQRYVDLGLGGHRVKCRIAPNFRLIVIDEKEVVYKHFPIPLINRLEKHVFEMSSILTDHQPNLMHELQEWVEWFSTPQANYLRAAFRRENTFPGYTNDTPASALILSKKDSNSDEENLELSKNILLQTASVDGVCRLSKSKLHAEATQLQNTYIKNHHHDSLLKLLQREIASDKRLKVFEVTSFSQILRDVDRELFHQELNLTKNSVMLLNLQLIHTEQAFNDKLERFFDSALEVPDFPHVLLIQCPQAQMRGNLIACAKYATLNKVTSFQLNVKSISCSKVIVVFIFAMERHINAANGKTSFASFHSKNCESFFVDDLKPTSLYLGPVSLIWNLTEPDMFKHALENIQEEANTLLDINCLISECIPEAMAKLHSEDCFLKRNRVTILRDTCFLGTVAKPFFQILVKHLLHLLEDRQKKSQDTDSWLVEVACSSQILQEGGSFRNAVWLYLRKLTATAVAKVISVVDADCNLDLLKANRFTDLWLRMFESITLFGMHWPDTRLAASFTVKTQFKCSFPFFRVIIEQLDKLWLIIEERKKIKAQQSESKRTQLIELLKSAAILTVLEVAAESKNAVLLLEKFIHDLVCHFYKPSSDNVKEIEIVRSCLKELLQAGREEYTFNRFVEVFVLYKNVQTNLIHFASLVDVNSKILEEGTDWIEEQAKQNELIVHKLSLVALLKKLHKQVDGSTSFVETCLQWLSSVDRIKPLAYLLISDSESDIKQIWTSIMFVEIFLNQLVPTSASTVVVQNYLTTIAPYARRLSKGISRFPDLSDKRFINIVAKALEGCWVEIELKLLCAWEEIKCKVCKADRMTEPVMLIPCKHFVCSNCIPYENDAYGRCPKCRMQISPDAELEPATSSAEDTKELIRFKCACSGFFLEYLSTFCFRAEKGLVRQQQTKTQKEIASMILRNLVLHDNLDENDLSSATDFGLDVVARSFILKLLLTSNEAGSVEETLNDHLQTMTNLSEEKSVLYDIYLHCVFSLLQDEESVGDNESDRSNAVQFALKKLNECKRANPKKFSQIVHLNHSAKMQYLIQILVLSIYALETKTFHIVEQRWMKQLVKEAGVLCQPHLIVQQAIVKILCQKFGIDSFELLLKNLDLRCYIPEYLIPDEEEKRENFYHDADMHVLAGKSYTSTKVKLQKITQVTDVPAALPEMDREIELSKNNVFEVIFCLSIWTAKDSNLPKALRKEVYDSISNHLKPHITDASLQQLLESIAEDKYDDFRLDSKSSRMQYKLNELLNLFSATVMWCGDGLLAFFANFIKHPEQFTRSFFPTMPASGFFEIKDVLSQDKSSWGVAKLFYCPNGHPYVIGECRRPNQAGICPECHQPIGGKNYNVLHEGNREITEITEESQAGYRLKPSSLKDQVTPERSLAKHSVCVIRFFLHAAMLLGTKNENDAIQSILGSEVENPSNYLQEHLYKNLTDLSHCLGRSVDDAVIAMHEVCKRMRVPVTIDEQACGVATMDARKLWESEFQMHYINPVVKNVDEIIQQAQTLLLDVGKLSEKPLERLVYKELDAEDNLPIGTVPWNCSQLWRTKIHVDINHLKLKLGVADEDAGGFGLLKTVLNMEEMHLIQHLELILDVQSFFIARYRQKLDIADADKLTLQQYIIQENYVYEDKIKQYIEVWNKIRHYLAGCAQYEEILEHLVVNMNNDSPVSMLIPSKRGRGVCARATVEYLIDQQNFILHQCRNHITPRPTFDLVDVSNLTKNDLICINKNKDLMPLIQSYHQYEEVRDASSGSKYNVVFNFGLLEKKIVEKFIARRKEIRRETIPLMLYPQDVGLASDYQAIKENKNLLQTPLPVRVCNDIDYAFENAQTANICDSVRTLTVVIQFLAKMHADPEQAICDFAEKELTLPTEEMKLIPRTAQLRHCLALYERLSWHRSKRMLQNGQNPFENVLQCAENIEEDDVIAVLKEVLKEMNIERLQIELAALMMVGPEMQPEWSLGEDVFPNYLEQKYENPDCSWCEKIPSEVQYKHSAHVFELSMELLNYVAE